MICRVEKATWTYCEMCSPLLVAHPERWLAWGPGEWRPPTPWPPHVQCHCWVPLGWVTGASVVEPGSCWEAKRLWCWGPPQQSSTYLLLWAQSSGDLCQGGRDWSFQRSAPPGSQTEGSPVSDAVVKTKVVRFTLMTWVYYHCHACHEVN